MRNFIIAVSLDDTDYRENLKKAKEYGADAVEYRIDSFQNLEINHCKEVINSGKNLGLKAILTIRDPKEGGIKPISNRLELYKALIPLADFADIEMRADIKEIEEVKKISKKNNVKLILSYHDFEKTPKENELESIFQEIIKKGADIAKVSFYAKNYEDISNLLCVAKKQPIPTITIAMGELGKISRLIGFLFNSVITYCSLEKPFAPGQISIKDLKRYLEYFFPKNSK